MAAGGNKLVLITALGANLGIAVAKFVAAAVTGSSAMLTEGFHSVVDSLNQILLLYGQKRSQRPPDALHPLGYGRELYFWSFVVAILIFATGAGLSIYEGILHILDPHVIERPIVSYIVLAVSIALEGTRGGSRCGNSRGTKGEQGWWQAIGAPRIRRASSSCSRIRPPSSGSSSRARHRACAGTGDPAGMASPRS